ncbi:uncharacterized protein [Diadema setosum]|uniref:uncharacterized protein n=1 Tax=Diadema setosum TaxID=31175 RepID=UPI003B3B296F
MALETLFETPLPLVSSENKESQNAGSERNLEEEGEILEDGELSDGGEGEAVAEQHEMEQEMGDYEGGPPVEHAEEEESPRKSRRRRRHHDEEAEEEEEDEDGEEERRRRRKRRKEKHSSRSRHHHKKSKHRKRHRSHSEEEAGSADEEQDAEQSGKFLEQSFPPRKRRSMHRERRRPTGSDPDDWPEQDATMRQPSEEEEEDAMMAERAGSRRRTRRGSRGGKKRTGRGGSVAAGDPWRMGRGPMHPDDDGDMERGGYGSSGADSYEEEMRKYKAYQEGYVDEESEEEDVHVPPPVPVRVPPMRGRGRGRGKGPPVGNSIIAEKLRKIANAAKMKGKNRPRPKEPRGEEKMMLHLICKFYLEGRCKKGENCTYSHDLSQQRKQELCKFYVSGYCNKGDSCLYMHEEFPCKYFHTGAECFQADKCRFSHAPLTAHTEMLLEKSLASFNNHDDRPPSKTKGLLPTPTDTSKIPSLLDIDVEPIGNMMEQDQGTRQMSFYGSENTNFEDMGGHHPSDAYGGDQFQSQDQYQDPYQDHYNRPNIERFGSSQDPRLSQGQDGPGPGDQQEPNVLEVTPLPSSQSEDNSVASDRDMPSSELQPLQPKKTLLATPAETSTTDLSLSEGAQSDSGLTGRAPPLAQPQDSEPPSRESAATEQASQIQAPPATIPARQKALLMRIQQKQHAGKQDVEASNAASEDSNKTDQTRVDDNWYSSDEEEGSKKRRNSRANSNEDQQPKTSSQDSNVPGLSAEAVKKLSSIPLPSALANLFAGKATSSAPASSGNQVTFNLLDFVKKGPGTMKPSPITPSSPKAEILDSPMSPTNEDFRLIECIREPGREDPRAGRQKKDKSDMRFRVLHWKDNKYSINDPEDRPSLPPIELRTPTELKSQPSYPKGTFQQFETGGQQQLMPQANLAASQVAVDPRMNRPQDPRLARMQDSQGMKPEMGAGGPPKDPRMNKDPRSLAQSMQEGGQAGDTPPIALLPTPDESLRLVGPRPTGQDGLLPFPPRGPLKPMPPMPDPRFMQGPRARGMRPPFPGPHGPMAGFQDMPPLDMNIGPRGPPFQGPRPPLGPGPRQRPAFNRPPLVRQMSDMSVGATGYQNYPSGPGDQQNNRFRGPAPGDPRSAPSDPRSAPKDPRTAEPKQASQDPRISRPPATESRDPRLATTESRDPRLSRQTSSSNNPSSASPMQSDNLPAQDIDERVTAPPPLMDVDQRQMAGSRKPGLQGFSIPKIQRRPDGSESAAGEGVESLDASGGIGHRKVPSAHHSQPQAMSSFDVGGRIRPNFPMGDPRTSRSGAGQDSPPVTLQIQIPGNGQGDGDMAAAIAQLAAEPEIQLKDMFKTQDPTASPFC